MKQATKSSKQRWAPTSDVYTGKFRCNSCGEIIEQGFDAEGLPHCPKCGGYDWSVLSSFVELDLLDVPKTLPVSQTLEGIRRR